MRRVLLALTAAVIAWPVLAQEDGIDWRDNYDEAVQEARRTGKPLFLEFRCEP